MNLVKLLLIFIFSINVAFSSNHPVDVYGVDDKTSLNILNHAGDLVKQYIQISQQISSKDMAETDYLKFEKIREKMINTIKK